MTLEAIEFIRRFLLHVLPSGFVHIRYFGFLANRKRKQKLALCRSLLSVPQVVTEASPDSPGRRDSTSEERFRRCPVCKSGRLILIQVLTAAACAGLSVLMLPDTHDRHECTVHQSTQLISPRQGDLASLFPTCIFPVQQRWLRLPSTGGHPPKREGDHFRHWVVSSSRAPTTARQTDRHSIPIAVGPAQFNGLYLKGSGPTLAVLVGIPAPEPPRYNALRSQQLSFALSGEPSVTIFSLAAPLQQQCQPSQIFSPDFPAQADVTSAPPRENSSTSNSLEISPKPIRFHRSTR